MVDYKLYCLGRPFLAFDGQPIKLEMRKALALLIYLRMAEHTYTRETLSSLFWPEYNQQRAQANLRRVLSSLNKSLQSDILLADREKIRLRDRITIWLDVEQFQQHRSAPKNHIHLVEEVCPDCIHNLEQAVQLYRGDFLAGFNLGDCAGFDEWQFFHCESLRQDMALTLQRLAEGYASMARWEQAILHARHWVSLDRLNETAQRMLIKLYDASGQRHASLRQYDELKRLLKEELGQKPELETDDLVHKIWHESTSTDQNRIEDFQSEPPGAQRVSEPILKTKLYIPSFHQEMIHRQHLIALLNNIDKHALIIISAPAGFGKTTSLVEWVGQTALPVAWLSLDNDDNDARRFINYIITAFESIQKLDSFEEGSILRASQSTSLQLVLTHLLNDLQKIQTHCVLVLDDYQFITSQTVNSLVTFLLEHLPPNIHIILSTRSDPPLKLSRLRSKGNLLEIRTKELRFNSKEAFDYLHHIKGLPLAEDEIIRLNNKIEGWIVGLQMAALSMREHENLSGFIESFSGTNRYILDYLLEEVLAGQPAEIQRFLLYTSILERLSTPLCDVILASVDTMQWTNTGRLSLNGETIIDLSASMLEHIEKANLFLVPLDNERIWYRYHHLFADLLRTRLQRIIGTTGVAKLHLYAADWHAQYGSILEAINHATAALDDERVERFIAQNYRELINRGEQSWMRSWTGKLGKDLVYRRPWLCIYEAMSHSWFGELDKAEKLLAVAEGLMQPTAETPDERSMLGFFTYVKSRVNAMRGDMDHAIELCLIAREIVPDNNLALMLDTQITLGYEYYLQSDFSKAIPVLNETIRLGKTVGAVINTVAASCILARLYVLKGYLQEAYQTYLFAKQLIPESKEEHRGAIALINVGLAEIFYERDELDSAFMNINKGLSKLPFWGKTDDTILAYVTLARILQAQANNHEVEVAVENAIQLVEASGIFPEARNSVEVARVQLWLNKGELAKAASWLEKQNCCSGSADIWQERKDIASIRVLLALGRSSEAQTILTQVISSVEEHGRVKHIIELLILQALILHRFDCDNKAIDILHQALTLAQPEGFIRIFLDEGQAIGSLLLVGNKKGLWRTGPLKEYIDVLLHKINP